MSEQNAHKTSPRNVPLWQQLQQVAQVIQQVQAGSSTATALEQVPAGLRPGVQALVYQVLRGLEKSGEAEKLFFKWYGPTSNVKFEKRTFRIESDKIDA